MTRVIAVVMLAGTLLAGCSQSVCRQQRSAVESLKSKACSADQVAHQAPSNDAEETACEERLDQCTDAEKQRMEDAASCLDDLGTCVAGHEQDWENFVAHCWQLENLSEKCIGGAPAMH